MQDAHFRFRPIENPIVKRQFLCRCGWFRVVLCCLCFKLVLINLDTLTSRLLPMQNESAGANCLYDPSNPNARRLLWQRLERSYVKHGITNFWTDGTEPAGAPYNGASVLVFYTRTFGQLISSVNRSFKQTCLRPCNTTPPVLRRTLSSDRKEIP